MLNDMKRIKIILIIFFIVITFRTNLGFANVSGGGAVPVETYRSTHQLTASPANGFDVKDTTTKKFQLPDSTIPQSMGIQIKTNDTSAANLDMIRSLGYKVVRRGFIWESIEKVAGIYDFSSYDRLMNDCRSRGLSVIGCIAFTNKLYGGTVLDDKGREGYARFAAALAEHYKDYNIIWEIWNEPNTMTFWGRHGGKGNTERYADEYLALVNVTVPAMHKSNPKCFVMAGSMSAFWDQSFNWMEFCFKKGILKSGIDAWSVHPYGTRNPEDYIEWYSKIRQMMVKSGAPATFPILNSERGYPIGKAEGYAGGDPKLSYEYQAWHIVRQYMIDLLCDIKGTIWYEWSGNEGFGLVKGNEKTPAFNAVKFMIGQLSGYRFDKRLPTALPRDFVLRFTNKAGSVKMMAWTSPPAGGSPDEIVPHQITIPIEVTGSLETFQLYGEQGTNIVQDGRITLNLTGAPQYITLNKVSQTSGEVAVISNK